MGYWRHQNEAKIRRGPLKLTFREQRRIFVSNLTFCQHRQIFVLNLTFCAHRSIFVTKNTPKMNQHGPQNDQKWYPKSSKIKPWSSFVPPWAPPGHPQGTPGRPQGPQGARKRHQGTFWSPKRGQTEAENLSNMQQKTTFISGRRFCRFWDTQSGQNESFLGVKNVPDTALDEFLLGEGRQRVRLVKHV